MCVVCLRYTSPEVTLGFGHAELRHAMLASHAELGHARLGHASPKLAFDATVIIVFFNFKCGDDLSFEFRCKSV